MCEQDTELFDLNDEQTRRFIEGLTIFNSIYTEIHKYICVLICLVGIVTNLIHMTVLMQPSLRRCAVNCVLTAVAICDVLTMTLYTVYLIRFRFFPSKEGYTYSWMLYLQCHVLATIALHSITLYLGALLAFIRWQALGDIHSKWLLPRSAWLSFFLCTFFVIVICIPTGLLHHIYVYNPNPSPVSLLGNDSDFGVTAAATSVASGFPTAATVATALTDVGPPTTAESNMPMYYTLDIDRESCIFFKLNLWLNAIVLKAVPCALLLWFTIALMTKLRTTDEKRNYLYSKSFRKHIRKTTVPDRTTYILTIVLSVFLITELPQGLLALLNGVFTNDVHKYIYRNLGELLDLLSLINCSVDFILYCFMSSRYRQTFTTLLVRAESWLRNRHERRHFERQFYRKAVLKPASPRKLPSESSAHLQLAAHTPSSETEHSNGDNESGNLYGDFLA